MGCKPSLQPLSRRHELLASLHPIGPLRTDRVELPGVAEPGREAARRFVKGPRWRGPSEVMLSPLPDPNDQTRGNITVHRLRRPLT